MGTALEARHDPAVAALVMSHGALKQAEQLLQDTLAKVQTAQRHLTETHMLPPTAKIGAVAALAPLSRQSLAMVRVLLDRLNGAESLVKCSAMAAACGVSPGHLSCLIDRLSDAGLLERTGRCRGGLHLRVINPFTREALDLVERAAPGGRRTAASRRTGVRTAPVMDSLTG